MSTNEELIDEVRAYPPVSEWDEPGEADEAMRRLADALEQTTRALEEAWRVAAEQTRLERGRAEHAETTLAKVRERVDDPLGWSHGLRRRADLLAILDESTSRPAPAEPTVTATRQAKAAAWDEACAAIQAWWDAPEDERSPVVNPYGSLSVDHVENALREVTAPAPTEASDCSGRNEVGVSWDEGLVLHEGDAEWHLWDESIYGKRPHATVPGPAEAGKREALVGDVYRLREDMRHNADEVAVLDQVLVALRAPIEDAEPTREQYREAYETWKTAGQAMDRALLEIWHAVTPYDTSHETFGDDPQVVVDAVRERFGDAEPFAHVDRRGILWYAEEEGVDRSGMTPLYSLPRAAAPIEVTDGVVKSFGDRLWTYGWRIPFEVLRAAITAAFKEMNR